MTRGARERIPLRAVRPEPEDELRRKRLMRERHGPGLRSFRGNRLQQTAVPGESRLALVGRHAPCP